MAVNRKDSGSVRVGDGTVTVSGWVQETRNLGGISFIVLRDTAGEIQLTLPKKKIEPTLFNDLTTLPRESAVEVTGEVKESKQATLGLEIIPTSYRLHSKAATPLPLGIVDKVNAEMDTRLNHRTMDLRKPEARAVFQIKGLVLELLGEASRSLGFTNVNTPKLVASGAEGGATLFGVDYFGRQAYLAQSPQLYKQMLMATGLDRVYELGPAFRAEHSNTNRHVTEFISFDGEMSWIESQDDVMDAIEEIMDHVFRGVAERGVKQLEALGIELKAPSRPYPKVTYEECLSMVREGGLDLADGDDLGTEGEKIIGDRMASKGIEMYWIVEYPEEAKPFYIMAKDGTPYSFSFDLDYKGQEISSGGQREHRLDVLQKRMREKGLDPSEFDFYLEAFRFGMPPHGGWGIGVERLVTKMLGLPNVREAILFPRDLSRLTP